MLESMGSHPVWRRVFPALLAADPRRRSLPPCRRTRRLWLWAVLFIAVLVVAAITTCHFLHSGKYRVVSVNEGGVSVREGVVPEKEGIASGKGDDASGKSKVSTERSIDSIFFVP